MLVKITLQLATFKCSDQGEQEAASGSGAGSAQLLVRGRDRFLQGTGARGRRG